MKKRITEKMLKGYFDELVMSEKSENTVSKYQHDLACFVEFLAGEAFDKSRVLAYKEALISKFSVTSVNSMLAAINSFFSYMGWHELRVKQCKVQKKAFCADEREISREEYTRLVQTAEKKNKRISLIMQTICATGIRVSELSFITAEAVRKGCVTVSLKGKTREVLLVAALQKKLLLYMKQKGITSGCVFVTRGGKPINRSNIWKEMKELCAEAGVATSKVFPHNLRHLFARTFYSLERDIARLADILGHSNINTTRIYTITTGEAHRRCLNRMHLIL